VRDGITIAREGIPVVVLVTTQFVDQATFVARAYGMPDVPIVVLPHPAAGHGDATLAAMARSATPQIAERLEGR
jgi:hypothetical protein